ncbi:hypothetical protein VPHD479_0288 [Vibrio phage D479]
MTIKSMTDVISKIGASSLPWEMKQKSSMMSPNGLVENAFYFSAQVQGNFKAYIEKSNDTVYLTINKALADQLNIDGEISYEVDNGDTFIGWVANKRAYNKLSKAIDGTAHEEDLLAQIKKGWGLA